MPRFKLVIEYAGTRYSGWQIQTNARTVQGEIDRAVRTITGRADFELYGSGRTDAGVHALAQVAHLDVATSLPAETLVVRLNDELPADINVLRASVVTHRFHARHDAVARRYLYQIARRRTAFAKPFVWWVREPLDLNRMREAAAAFVGMRDFLSFAALDESARGSREPSESSSGAARASGSLEPSRGAKTSSDRAGGARLRQGYGASAEARRESSSGGWRAPARLNDRRAPRALEDDGQVGQVGRVGQVGQVGRVGQAGRRSSSDGPTRPQTRSTLVLVERLDIVEADDLVMVGIEGLHFLWKMVRRIVGVLVEIGRGGLEPSAAAAFLLETSNTPARLTAPASGLFLERVWYDGDVRDEPLRAATPVTRRP